MKKTAERDGKTRPLIVCDEGGKFLFLSATNEKGYVKSLERGSLWTVHPDTDRLLPDSEASSLHVLEDRGGYYYAEVSIAEVKAGEAAEEAAAGKKSGGADSEEVSSLTGKNEAVLRLLTEIIRKRKRELPEGSYTTHLFRSGLDKIRKKTGEEAVELILAREPGEIVYEAADLIYHLIVLLEAEGLGLNPVLEELEKRTK